MGGGESRVLVVRGDAGVGKTALLSYVESRAMNFAVARAAGVESEMEVAFAGLHQLCHPLLSDTDRLAEPHRRALGTALGLMSGEPPDLLLIGGAVLNLLSDSAETRSLVCLIDDVQWLDKASADVLAFVARRLLAEPVAMVLVAREPWSGAAWAGLPELILLGLADDDARALLDAAIPGKLDDQVRERIIAEAAGNPLALLELTRSMTPAELAGGFRASASRPLATLVERAFEKRLRSLSADAQTLLQVAAADPVGDRALVLHAAALLGAGESAPDEVEEAGLLETRSTVRFTHPLARSAVYRATPPRDRRAVHRALADATDVESDSDRRAWHRAHASVGPDEEVADELERSAARACKRGGVAAAAAFFKRATELTPDAGRRGARALAAAQAALDAASTDEASRMLATASLCPLDPRQQAIALRLRARVAFVERRGTDAPPLLLEAAQRLEEIDPRLSRETYLDALEAAIFAGRSAGDVTLADIAESAHRSPPSPDPSVVDMLVAGLASRYTEGFVAAVPTFRGLFDAIRANKDDGSTPLQSQWMACRVASELWEDEIWHELAVRQLKNARDAGEIRALPYAITYRAGVHIHAGEFAAASSLIAEATSLTESIGGAPLLYATIVLAAWSGDQAELQRALDWGVPDATSRGEGRGLTWCEYGTALLHNGLGNYPQALDAAADGCRHDDFGVVNWCLVELIEAAARSGRPDVAADGLERLADRTRASGSDWALAMDSRSRALLSEGPVAEGLYRDSIERLARTRVAVHSARAHLIYGEWLRRENRRIDAREQLRAAHEMFVHFGADGYAERARRELLATGESVAKRKVKVVDALTAQEAHIAQLAKGGMTNAEIGTQLFISPRTVEYHLRKVFTKLGVSSRRELVRAQP